MPLYDAGPTTPYDSLAAIPPDVFGVAINWFVNRTPLLSRLPKLPVGSGQFKITNDNYRPRSVATTAAFSDTSGTVLTVADSSVFEQGDVIQVDSEIMLVTVPLATATTATVVRGYAGSAAATHLSGAIAYLLTNTRTGAEINVSAISRNPVTVTQTCQTIQHAYSVGGSLQSNTNYVSGEGTPLDRDRMLAIQHCMDDFEGAVYSGSTVTYGSATTRPMMTGITNLLVTNRVTSPTNAAAYKPSDLVRDTLQSCFNGGGNPSVLLVSTDFLTGLAVWGHAAMRVNAGTNIYGTPIDLFEAPFLSGISIVPAPLLRAGSAICLSGPEARIRMKRNLFEKPRGSRGDAAEGDFIVEGAVELDNEAHHAYVTGITAFAAA